MILFLLQILLVFLSHYTKQIIESQSKCIIWLKFDKSYFNLDKNLYICAVYIPPIESTAYTKNNKYIPYDILENEYIKYSGLRDTVIVGDFNARSGHLADYIESSHHDIINDEMTNKEITTCGTNCVKDRTSCDNTINQSDRSENSKWQNSWGLTG